MLETEKEKQGRGDANSVTISRLADEDRLE
jgi:hypothetical protein